MRTRCLACVLDSTIEPSSSRRSSIAILCASCSFCISICNSASSSAAFTLKTVSLAASLGLEGVRLLALLSPPLLLSAPPSGVPLASSSVVDERVCSISAGSSSGTASDEVELLAVSSDASSTTSSAAAALPSPALSGLGRSCIVINRTESFPSALMADISLTHSPKTRLIRTTAARQPGPSFSSSSFSSVLENLR